MMQCGSAIIGLRIHISTSLEQHGDGVQRGHWLGAHGVVESSEARLGVVVVDEQRSIVLRAV